MHLSPGCLTKYEDVCRANGQSEDTIRVKIRNLQIFANFCAKQELTHGLIHNWRAYIAEKYATPHSRNNMICKTNVFLDFLGLAELRIAYFQVDRRKLYLKARSAITIDEFKAMLEYTEKTDAKANLLLRVLATTGIRSGEIHHITVEAVAVGSASFIHHKKPRKVLLPLGLCKMLSNYAQDQGITAGPVFISRRGNPIHQRGIGVYLKNIAENVGIERDKINPTAFRILFANVYYQKYGDLSGLTDLLGVTKLDMTVLYVQE
ncbi:MAG: tyrosine-type recombinase/integrase [Defluviitaleaceae bacterium]|nr:tyrosine-type recombinase/integrase [Defluviitaleaceae bacterium]MCL2276177.1 tyrosine-type recombinase/integrase [Defluviitaleaceae bacterium]